jgi:hypothetical protein
MEKRLKFCLFLVLFCITQNSLLGQAKKNQLLVGGQYSFGFKSDTETLDGPGGSSERGKSRNFEITPKVGYFIFDNTVIGLNFIYRFNKDIYPESMGYVDYNYDRYVMLIPFMRYYIGTGLAKPYLHAGIGPGWEKSVSKQYNWAESIQEARLIFYELNGGVGIFLNKYISFDFGLGFEFFRKIYTVEMEVGPSYDWNQTWKGFNSRIGIVVCI